MAAHEIIGAGMLLLFLASLVSSHRSLAGRR
jgi:hypothetical protein